MVVDASQCHHTERVQGHLESLDPLCGGTIHRPVGHKEHQIHWGGVEGQRQTESLQNSRSVLGYRNRCNVSTWCGEFWSVSKASVLLLIGMGQLLEAAISHIWSQRRTFSRVCSDGCAFLQSVKDPLPIRLQSSTIILPLRKINCKPQLCMFVCRVATNDLLSIIIID